MAAIYIESAGPVKTLCSLVDVHFKEHINLSLELIFKVFWGFINVRNVVMIDGL